MSTIHTAHYNNGIQQLHAGSLGLLYYTIFMVENTHMNMHTECRQKHEYNKRMLRQSGKGGNPCPVYDSDENVLYDIDWVIPSLELPRETLKLKWSSIAILSFCNKNNSLFDSIFGIIQQFFSKMKFCSLYYNDKDSNDNPTKVPNNYLNNILIILKKPCMYSSGC